jgi:hypothetical protein
MFEYASQLRRNALHAADRNPQLAIVDGAAPGRRAGHVEERLLRIKRDGDRVAGRVSQIARTRSS